MGVWEKTREEWRLEGKKGRGERGMERNKRG
jgi:hypothetical protein